MEGEQNRIDFFSQLMFGDRTRTNPIYSSKEKTERVLDPDHPNREDEPVNLPARSKPPEDEVADQPLEAFLFGIGPNHKKENILGEYLKNIDFDELFNHVETLMTTAKELRPVMRKMKPFVDMFLKK